MRESIGHALLLFLIVTFIGVIGLVFAESINYSKAYKLKNRIVNIIEEHGGYTTSAQEEINEILSDVGYQVNRGNPKCQRRSGAIDVYPTAFRKGGFNYCVVKYDDSKGREYYGVTTFMKFDFPFVGGFMEFPVYGETKTFGILD